MKKQYVSLLAIILSVSGFLFSCHDKMNKNTGALQFDSIQVNETAHLFNDTARVQYYHQLRLSRQVVGRDAERQSERLLHLRLLRRQIYRRKARSGSEAIRQELH